MKKQPIYCGLIAGLIVIMGISGCAATQGAGPEPAAQKPPEPERMYVMRGDGMPARVSVTNQSGTFTLENRNAPDEVDRTRYNLPELAGHTPDTLAISVLMERAGTLEAFACKEITASTDMAAYGLAAPQALLEVTYMDGSVATLLVGSESETGTYCMQQGGAQIYLVESAKIRFFFYDALQFLDKTITTAVALQEHITMELDGSLYGQEIVLEFTAVDTQDAPEKLYESRILQPLQVPLSEDVLEALQSVFGLRATRIVSQTTGADGLVEAYGLDAPYCRLRVYSAEGEGFTLRMTEPDATGHAYLLREGVPFIFEAAAEQLPWLAVRLEHMTGETAFLQQDVLEQLLTRPA